MVREFFSLRVFLFFFLFLWGSLTAAGVLAVRMTPKERRKFVKTHFIPVVSALISLLMTIVLVIFVSQFN